MAGNTFFQGRVPCPLKGDDVDEQLALEKVLELLEKISQGLGTLAAAQMERCKIEAQRLALEFPVREQKEAIVGKAKFKAHRDTKVQGEVEAETGEEDFFKYAHLGPRERALLKRNPAAE